MPQALAVSSDIVYVAGGSQIMEIFDATNAASVKRLGGYPTGRRPLSVIVDNQRLFLVDGLFSFKGVFLYNGELKCFDISQPATPVLTGTYPMIGGLCGIRGNLLHAIQHEPVESGHDEGSLVVLDVSNPTNIRPAAQPLPGIGHFAVLEGNHIHAAPFQAGLKIYELTDLPAITTSTVHNGTLTLEWNDVARGLQLQRTTDLVSGEWQTLVGSEATNRVALPLWGGPEFFRLAKP